MINAIAEAKTGRSMKKFMTQINSVVGAGGIRIAEISTYEHPSIAARCSSGRRDVKSCPKTRYSFSNQMGTGSCSGVRSCLGSGGESSTPCGCRAVDESQIGATAVSQWRAACWPSDLPVMYFSRGTPQVSRHAVGIEARRTYQGTP